MQELSQGFFRAIQKLPRKLLHFSLDVNELMQTCANDFFTLSHCFYCNFECLRTIANGLLAERKGFEPSIRYERIHAFQACDFNHSSTSLLRFTIVQRVLRICTKLERVMGIEPTFRAWEAFVLPLNYTRAHPYTSITEDVIIAILCVVRELLCTNQVNFNPDD